MAIEDGVARGDSWSPMHPHIPGAKLVLQTIEDDGSFIQITELISVESWVHQEIGIEAQAHVQYVFTKAARSLEGLRQNFSPGLPIRPSNEAAKLAPRVIIDK